MHQSNGHGDTGGSRSLWMRATLPAFDARLDDVSSADVCVIGAGIAGLTTAYQCLTRGHSVIVVDGGTIGGGETLRTTAHLANALDDRFVALERRHGQRGAHMLADAHGAAIEWIQTFCATHQIACSFARVPGYLYGKADTTREELEHELAAARRAGLDAELVESPPLPEMGKLPAIRFTAQAEIDPAAYIAGLAQAVVKAGGRIHEGVLIDRVDEHPDTGEPCEVVARDGRIVRAKHVVVATNAPITSMTSIPLKQAAYRSYVVTLEVPKDSVPHALYWDMEDPYHYVRVADGVDAEHDLLIVGGEDHKTGQDLDPEARFEKLERWARDRFPYVGQALHHWSGQIMEPADSVGFVGRNPGSKASVFVISGDSGNGLTLGTLGAHIVTDLIEGRRNVWSEVFEPSRNMLHAVGPFLRENANVAAQYVDLVAGGDAASVNEIPCGHGAVVRDGAQLLAVYRDADGACHTCSAICPHLEGVVHWNAVEKSWDCPCHGSRFDAFGRVIIGPSTSDLRAVTPEKIASDPEPVEAGLGFVVPVL